MISEKWIFWPNRVPNYVVWLASTAVLALIAQVFVDNWFWTASSFVPMAVFIESVSRSPRVAAILVARRNIIALAVAFSLFLSGLILEVLLASGDGGKPGIPHITEAVLAYFLVGFLLGVLLRHEMSRTTLLTLFGRHRLGAHIALMATWAACVAILPIPEHSESVGSYLIGLGAGFLFHKGTRIHMQQGAAAYRRLQEVVDAWPPRAPAPEAEHHALRLLVAGRQIPSMKFTKLRRFLEKCRVDGLLTKRLALISACVYRLEGQYEAALNEITNARLPKHPLIDANLQLLRVLCLEELSDEVAATQILDRLVKTKAGARCPLAAATAARRSAEAVLENPAEATPTPDPMLSSLEALELRKKITTERASSRLNPTTSIGFFLSRFVEVGVPVTPSLFMDTMGVSSVAAGYIEEARLYLQRCILIDADFSYGYLHLGDAFLFRSRFLFGASQPSNSDSWHARACYEAALRIERNRGSRVRRLARARLERLQQFGA